MEIIGNDEKEIMAMEKVFNLRKRNSVKIVDINMKEYYGEFEEWYSNEWYDVIDTDYLGECIGREIGDELGKKIINENGEYDECVIYEKIDENVDFLIERIKEFVIEFLDGNLDNYVDD